MMSTDSGEVIERSETGAIVWTLSERDFIGLDYRYVRDKCYRTEPGVKVTPAWLLALSLRATERHKELSTRFPAGTIHDERNLMRELSDSALEVAAWMESRQQNEATFAGPFGPQLPVRGSWVRIRDGAEVLSTHPQKKRSEIGRVLKVRVHSVDRGYLDVLARPERNEQRVRNPAVHWAGTGGYWRWTDANNILLEEQAGSTGN